MTNRRAAVCGDHRRPALKALVAASLLALVAQAAAQPLPRSYVASPEVYKVVGENAQALIIEATWAPGQRDRMHAHPSVASYALTDCKLRNVAPSGLSMDMEMKAGQTSMPGAVPGHAVENIGSSTCRLVMFELKAPAAPAAPAAAASMPASGMAGNYSPVERIPVDDPQTKAVTAALFMPPGAGPFPAAIVLSGCAGLGPDVPVVKRLLADYGPAGVAVLVLDSFTPRGIDQVCNNPNMAETVGMRVRDAKAARAWLAARPDIDARRIYLQGYSHGAITAIAATDAQYPQAAQHGFAGVVAFYPYCNAKTRLSVPTVMLLGGKDDWTPPGLCQDIADKTNVQITLYPEATHGFAAQGVDVVYLGHRLRYDAAATQDALRRALALMQVPAK